MNKRKRCPNGTRKNKKTGNCESKKINLKKSTKKKALTSKKCPPNKPLYNPLTKRCVLNNTANQKKIKKIVENLHEKRQTPLSALFHTPVRESKESPHIMISPSPAPSPIRKIIEPLRSYDNIYPSILCNSKQKFSNVNLNNLIIEGMSPHIIYKDGSSKIVLKNIQYIASGSYGSVYRLFDEKNTINVAMKKMNNPHDDEYKIIETLQKKGVDCNMLNVKILNLNETGKVVLSNFYNGSLDELFGRLEFGTVLNIFKQLVYDFKCLYDKGFVYTDLKGGNILYKCVSDSHFKVTVADLGSICKKNSLNLSTYLPWDQRTEEPAYIKCKESSIVWGLGVLFMQMLSGPIDAIKMDRIFLFHNIKDKTSKEVNDYVKDFIIKHRLNNILIKDHYYVSNLLRDMLNLTQKNRITLQQLQNKLI